MRFATIARAVCLCLVLPMGLLYAQSNVLFEQFELLDPNLSASLLACDANAPTIEPWQVPPAIIPCWMMGTNNGTAVASDGSVIKWLMDTQAQDPACPVLQRNALRVFVTRPGTATAEVLRVYSFRGSSCDASNCGTRLTDGPQALYDLTNGRLLIRRDVNITDCTSGQNLAQGSGIVAVTGFPTLLDVALTYQPPSTLSFNVPVHPEGLAGADSFSVYTGEVGTVSDLSQAAPMQCTVPAGRPPVPGELLTVPDNLPEPPPGDARYYLAAVEYQAQTRAGRQAIDGVLRGRNAAALVGCP